MKYIIDICLQPETQVLMTFQNLTSKPLLNRYFSYSKRNHSLSSPKPNLTNWNTSHSLVHSNPLLSLLEKCKSLTHLKQIQSQMVLTGLISDGFASSRLIAFCAISESRNLDYCTKILYSTKQPTSFSWNVAIRGFSESENPRKALGLYKRMLSNGKCRPDNYTYTFLCKVCGFLEFWYMGHEVLDHIVKLGFEEDVFVHNAVINMLVLLGELSLARKVFDECCVRDLVSWNSLIKGYNRCGKPREALKIYDEMVKAGVNPDEVTMIGVVSSCAQMEDLKRGRDFHMYAEGKGLNLTISLANALMDMYVKCGNLEVAKLMFDNMKERTVISWTTMIMGYAKLGLLDTAREFFYKMPEKNVVAWNSIIGSYAQANHGKEALVLLHEMQASNMKPDEVTMIHCLSACSQLGALDLGLWIHHYIKKHNLPVGVGLGTALVDMYAKCGNIARALQVFHEMPMKNSLTWTTIIGGLAIHGNAEDAVSYFSMMIDAGVTPDGIAFLAVLSACCHGGLVEQGRKYFTQMRSKFNLLPQLKHYSCMVDLLGRAGFLEEAEGLIKTMSMEADAAVWGALFFACRIYGNIPMGERAASKVLQLDPYDSGIYVLLANMYREANMLEEANKIWKIMRETRMEKTPGSSLIEVNGVVQEFMARDRSHPNFEKIHECLIQLTKELAFEVEIFMHSWFQMQIGSEGG